MSDTLKPACAERVQLISKNDLPLACPSVSMEVWSAHPRVYLAIDEVNNTTSCPYCGTKYVLSHE